MNPKIKEKLASLTYNFLINTVGLTSYRHLDKLWWKLWNRNLYRFSCPVNTNLHGYPARVNYGYTYPVNARLFPQYNNPLVELVQKNYSLRKSPITLIDVGAAVGDTIFLVYSNCPAMIKEFYCFDGDPEFFEYLQNNLSCFPEGKLFNVLLSSSEGFEKELIRTHRGTASAQGEKKINSVTLDSILYADLEAIDLLKIDVDGFDGKILLGTQKSLLKYQPSVIFEWHPLLCEKTGNSWTDHFECLTDCGYNQFIWFNKYGEFSHFMVGYNQETISLTAQHCLSSKVFDDWHYDVIALPNNSELSPVALADSAYSKKRRSHY
jgi:FkbM family methyltransferase